MTDKPDAPAPDPEKVIRDAVESLGKVMRGETVIAKVVVSGVIDSLEDLARRLSASEPRGPAPEKEWAPRAMVLAREILRVSRMGGIWSEESLAALIHQHTEAAAPPPSSKSVLANVDATPSWCGHCWERYEGTTSLCVCAKEPSHTLPHKCGCGEVNFGVAREGKGAGPEERAARLHRSINDEAHGDGGYAECGSGSCGEIVLALREARREGEEKGRREACAPRLCEKCGQPVAYHAKVER